MQGAFYHSEFYDGDYNAIISATPSISNIAKEHYHSRQLTPSRLLEPFPLPDEDNACVGVDNGERGVEVDKGERDVEVDKGERGVKGADSNWARAGWVMPWIGAEDDEPPACTWG